jgi:hypothetical protein
MLNFVVLLSDDPFLPIDLLQKKSDLSLMFFFKTGRSLGMKIVIFLLNILDLSFVHFFQFQDSFPQKVIICQQALHLLFISVF